MAGDYLSSPAAAIQEGAAVVVTRVLNTRVIAIANLIPALAFADGRPYTDKQQADWNAMVGTFWAILVSQRGQVHDASQMVGQLRQEVRDHLQNSNIDAVSFDRYNADSSLAADLESMLSYVTSVCAQQHADREKVKATLRERRSFARRVTASARQRANAMDTAFPGADMAGYVKRAFR
ncbi:hypothetical protein LTR85_002275 [Meristemomyces frigidus]|nr:hypothetical protein LTR85_002275 [Meristemomyces frigidus]